ISAATRLADLKALLWNGFSAEGETRLARLARDPATPPVLRSGAAQTLVPYYAEREDFGKALAWLAQAKSLVLIDLVPDQLNWSNSILEICLLQRLGRFAEAGSALEAMPAARGAPYTDYAIAAANQAAFEWPSQDKKTGASSPQLMA